MIDIKELVEGYINAEVDYLKREEEFCGFDKRRDASRIMLEYLTDEDIEKLTNKVLDDKELNDKFNETIHYYLYH